MLGTGTVDRTPVYPREVVKRALELSATAIIVRFAPIECLSFSIDADANEATVKKAAFSKSAVRRDYCALSSPSQFNTTSRAAVGVPKWSELTVT